MLPVIFLVACIAGTVQHFLYEPFGRPRCLRWLLPVSESPWEHTKLCFWPLGGALVAAGRLLGAELSGILWAWLLAGAHSIGTMLSIYYLYRAALGVPRPVLWVDIGNFFVTMLCAWPIGLRALVKERGWAFGLPAAALLGAVTILFQLMSGRPPKKYPLFREEHANGRDQRTGTS